jgi:hypothetical protein
MRTIKSGRDEVEAFLPRFPIRQVRTQLFVLTITYISPGMKVQDPNIQITAQISIMTSSLPLPADINILSHFLAYPQISELTSSPPVDCITICASAVLHQATKLFEILQAHPQLTRTLVLCGGIGHSTPLIYEAVSQHPTYQAIALDIEGLPEAKVLEKILTTFFDVKKITSQGMKILVEDQSTNCGANASRTRQLLEKNDVEVPKSLLIVQDPTMSLRTVASFRKVYQGVEIEIKSAPIFVPAMEGGADEIRWDVDEMSTAANELWEKERFFDLILGEIPRLRDDVEGYGPKGKGFIVHVNIPDEVEEAWMRLTKTVKGSR